MIHATIEPQGKVFLERLEDSETTFAIGAFAQSNRQYPIYYYTGTTTTTWTLPRLGEGVGGPSWDGLGFFIKNASGTAAATMTLNTALGNAIIVRGSNTDTVASMTLDYGSCIFIANNGTLFYVLMYQDA